MASQNKENWNNEELIMAKIILDIELPAEVTKQDLEHFLNYKFLGHAGTEEVLSKFNHEELAVNFFNIETNG